LDNRIYTIGYSPFSVERLIDLFRQYSITAVCDVRSMPYSRYKPEFNKAHLEKSLASWDIKYFFLGKSLGGRPDDPELYENGRVNFRRLEQSSMFLHGLDSLKGIVQEYTTVLLCAEKDPITCHRTILVCRQLRNYFDIVHILEDGTEEANRDTERRLVKYLNIPTDDLFRTEEELIRDAYDQQGKKIAFMRKE
jgi:uncharacterized protein (DUF488 family)